MPEPSTPDLFRRLDALEEEAEPLAHTGHNRWMIPYADLLTLLLGLLLVLTTVVNGRQSEAKAGHPAVPPVVQGRDHSSSVNGLAALLRQNMQRQKLAFQPQDAEIQEQERGVVISLREGILFTPGSADLSPAARRTMDRLADQLQRTLAGTPYPIRVEGHTDDTPITAGRYPSNWELSTARATNIVRYLAEHRRFPPERLSAAGYGEFRPVADNSSIEGKRKNRRVDIVILNGGGARQEPPAENDRRTTGKIEE